MTFEEFKKKVIEEIRDYLPDEYADAEFRFMDVDKVNSSYTGLTFTREGSNISPSIDMEYFYQKTEEGRFFGEGMIEIAEMLQMRPEMELSQEELTDIEKVKDRLFIRVSDAGTNRYRFSEIPYTEVNGLAITYHIQIAIDEGGIGSAMVTDKLLESFGISEEQLHDMALENSERILPAKIDSLEKVMNQMLGMEESPAEELSFDDALSNLSDEDKAMMCLTNSRKVNGAAVIFYPDVMKKIGDRFQINFFILPSSTHEVLLVPDDGIARREVLEQMVRGINRDVVDRKDFLSDDVYHYDYREHRLEKAVDFDRRIGRDMEQEDAAKAAPKPRVHKRDEWER